MEPLVSLSRRKQGFESPRERHQYTLALIFLGFSLEKSHRRKSGTLNVRHLSFAIAASASFFLRAARV
jgi:hypothetical protein